MDGATERQRGAAFSIRRTSHSSKFLGEVEWGVKELHHQSCLSREMNKLESFSLSNLIAFYKLLLFCMHECFGYM